jgi:hypothetical protein
MQVFALVVNACNAAEPYQHRVYHAGVCLEMIEQDTVETALQATEVSTNYT